MEILNSISPRFINFIENAITENLVVIQTSSARPVSPDRTSFHNSPMNTEFPTFSLLWLLWNNRHPTHTMRIKSKYSADMVAAAAYAAAIAATVAFTSAVISNTSSSCTNNYHEIGERHGKYLPDLSCRMDISFPILILSRFQATRRRARIHGDLPGTRTKC